MTYDSLTNRGDYLSPHYLAEVLPRELAKKDGLRALWAARDDSPVKALRALKRGYFAARPDLADVARRIGDGEPVTDDERRTHEKSLKSQNEDVLRALGFVASREVVDVGRSLETFGVPVVYHGQNVVAVDCGWAADTDAALAVDQAGRLLDPVQVGTSEWIEIGSKLARWLFDTDEPPRYVLLLHGGVLILADRFTWGEGRYLAVSLDIAIDRADPPELETIAALFSADVLQPPAEGGSEQLAQWVDESRKHAVGVSAELREGLRESVQIIANEVLDRIRSNELDLREVADLGDLAKELGREALRYLYRILFLLYAEARPELGILPSDDQDYMAGYSMYRLGERVSHRLIGEEARSGFHLYESLNLLFRMVNEGHRARGNASTEGLSEGEGIRFESLKADLFDPSRTHRIGHIPDPRHDNAPLLDTRLRDEALHKVLRRLMLAKGSGRKGKNQRGGFISYAQLGINQLGAVYEELMSYTGFIATEKLYEVAKKGDAAGGSWMVTESKVPGYSDDVFVKEKDENGFLTGGRVWYHPGSFVYRLAGRDRQTSASYYTPQSLTSVTVQLALEQRVKEEGRPVSATEVLRWRVCEPALGSGAFLNEAIDQLAALYLRLREEETGDRLEPDERAVALLKVKAYIALHNCYGVDLNETAVELAEVSIWLNVMHRGLQAPWFGLHLVRGNSLIGAGRRVYSPDLLAKTGWLKSAPEDVPFSSGPIPAGHVHHFLLPADGWGCVAGEKEARELAPEDTKRLGDWRKKVRSSPSPKKSLGHKQSQVQRLQDLAGRAEYLWSLVIDRLRISEREISRTIDVWGASDLPSAEEAKPREEILSDLTSPGTPYWRLKTVMDAWCALWFWPVDKAGLLDGSDPIYERGPVIESVRLPESVDAEPTPAFPITYVKTSLFEDEPEQLSLTAARRKSPPPKPRVARRAQVALKDFEDWLEFAESILGRQAIPPDSLVANFKLLSELEDYEDQLEIYMGMDQFYRLPERFPWLDIVADIAEAQGFFHWELRFAQVLADDGFDLQLGNPPWVRPEWDESAVLAEFEPWFELVEKPPESERVARRSKILESSLARMLVLDERTVQSGVSTFLGSIASYALLVGTRPDFYRGFMLRCWRNARPVGVTGLLHPDTHFVGDAERFLRAEAGKRLRIHGDFVNSGNRFFPPPVNRSSHFGIHIYGKPKQIGFFHLGWLLDAEELPKSLALAESGEVPEWWDAGSVPGVKYKGDWDARPHPERVVWVDSEMLVTWRLVTGAQDQPLEHTKLLNLVTMREQDAIIALGKVNRRLADFVPRISQGFNETNDKKRGLIRTEIWDPDSWSEVILKGPQIGVATPFFKQPPDTGTKGRPQNLTTLPDNAIPRSALRRATSLDSYLGRQDTWIDFQESAKIIRSRESSPVALTGLSKVHESSNVGDSEVQIAERLNSRSRRPYSSFYRLVWRRMIPDDTDRSLFSAIYPPGPTHVHSVHSLALDDNYGTVLTAGFWAGLPMDYLLRVTVTNDLQSGATMRLPAPFGEHPLAIPLLLRSLRLNCLTDAYADLWEELYTNSWCCEQWVVEWPNVASLSNPGAEWSRDTPLRSEIERRAALVEIDALVAVWLGINIEQLEAIYPARYPILGDYEDVTWFDAAGRKIAGNWNTFGSGQTKEHWEQFQKFLEDPAANSSPNGYEPPFYKADRISEYRQAHAVFSERLRQARDTR